MSVASAACYKVLIADDNRDGADSLALLFELHGHNVVVAYDGPTALHHYYSFMPDVAILDINMPQLDGYEVARAILRDAVCPPILIAVTGAVTRETPAKARAAGFDAHLSKPYDMNDLMQVIHDAPHGKLVGPRCSAVEAPQVGAFR